MELMLSPGEFQRIRSELDSAFNHKELVQLVHFTTGEDLDKIADAGSDKTFEVVKYAVRHKCLIELLTNACRERSRRRSLQAVLDMVISLNERSTSENKKQTSEELNGLQVEPDRLDCADGHQDAVSSPPE